MIISVLRRSISRYNENRQLKVKLTLLKTGIMIEVRICRASVSLITGDASFRTERIDNRSLGSKGECKDKDVFGTPTAPSLFRPYKSAFEDTQLRVEIAGNAD